MGGELFFKKLFGGDERGVQGGLPPWSSKIFESIDPNRANLKLFRTFFYLINIEQIWSYFEIEKNNNNIQIDSIEAIFNFLKHIDPNIANLKLLWKF